MTLGAEDQIDPTTIALDVASHFDRIGVAYVIGGSFASALHGEPRSTKDVDFVAALDAKSGAELVHQLTPTYVIDADAVQAAIGSATSFNAIHIAGAFKADVFVAGDDAFEAERLRTRLRIDVIGGQLWIDTAEHTILRKLEWYRRGGETSERQWRDVEAVVRIQGDRLDRERLAKWARYLGVSRLLRKVLAG